MILIHWIIAGIGAGLLVWAGIRWRMCPASHPDRGARRDMAILALLLVVGVAGDAFRSRFALGSAGFYAATAALAPIAIAALAIVVRMVSAYRSSRGTESTQAPAGVLGRRE
ncbi:MAG TPA: hypothetical protein VKT77_00370 [Chthonomonadaceae bacterium]|nr:hypothetical protein [Chthonomonadaceae bacterium]